MFDENSSRMIGLRERLNQNEKNLLERGGGDRPKHGTPYEIPAQTEPDQNQDKYASISNLRRARSELE